MDSGGVNTCVPTKPFGVGDVCLSLLLRHDLLVVDLVCCWLSQEQSWLGSCCKSKTQQYEVKNQVKQKKKRGGVISKFFFFYLQDFVYHGLAVLFYLSAGVDLAFITMLTKGVDLKIYRTYISAVVRCSSYF